jgi:hypothetical protein
MSNKTTRHDQIAIILTIQYGLRRHLALQLLQQPHIDALLL